MPDSEPKISSLDDLKSSVPILPSDMQKDLGLIAFSNSLELDMAIFQAELDAKEIEEASKGSMVKTAEEQYETALNTIGKHGQHDISRARENLQKTQDQQVRSTQQLERAKADVQFSKGVDALRTRLARPITWPIAGLCVLALSVGGNKIGDAIDEKQGVSAEVIVGTLFGAAMGGAIGYGVIEDGRGGAARIRARRQIRNSTQAEIPDLA